MKQIIAFIIISFNITSYALVNGALINERIPIVQIHFKGGSHICSGMFIDSTTILTAGHCVSDARTWEGFSLEVESVLDQDGRPIEVEALSTIPHPDFRYSAFGNRSDLGGIKTSPYDYQSEFPKLSSRSLQRGVGTYYACGKTGLKFPFRACLKGSVAFSKVLSHYVSWGETYNQKPRGKDASVHHNDSGGVLVDERRGEVIGVIWGTFQDYFGEVKWLSMPSFSTPLTKGHLDFLKIHMESEVRRPHS